MGRICILKEHADELRNRLISGELSVDELYNLDSPTRQAKLREFLPEAAAKQVNSDFESKLILKNQQRGLQNWLNKQVDMTPAAKRDMLSKVQRMDKILGQDNGDEFLADLAETKLGARVTVEQANEISRLAKDVEEKVGTQEYGYARADFDQYLEDLKSPTNKSGLGDTLKASLRDIKENPLKIVSYTGGISKSIKAALDNSSLLRQGFKTLVTNPSEWLTNAKKSFQYIYGTFKGQDVMREIRASMYNDTKYFDMAQIADLAIGVDDAIPTTLQEKIPGIGKLFAASDNAFKGFLFKTRFDVFKKYVQLAENAGVDIGDKEALKNIANMVNSQTGRGKIAMGGEKIANEINNVFFSPRFIAAQLDTFLHPLTGGQGLNGIAKWDKSSNFVRKEATKSLAKTIAAVGAIMATANAVSPGSAETDPRSTDFGKIKVGNTRFDITGGLGSLITFIARESTGTVVSSSGKKSILNNPKEFRPKTHLSVAGDYMRNKLSPILGTSINLIEGQDPIGNKFGLKNVPKSLLMPLPISNTIEVMNDPNGANAIATIIADFLGVATNTYGK